MKVVIHVGDHLFCLAEMADALSFLKEGIGSATPMPEPTAEDLIRFFQGMAYTGCGFKEADAFFNGSKERKTVGGAE